MLSKPIEGLQTARMIGNPLRRLYPRPRKQTKPKFTFFSFFSEGKYFNSSKSDVSSPPALKHQPFNFRHACLSLRRIQFERKAGLVIQRIAQPIMSMHCTPACSSLPPTLPPPTPKMATKGFDLMHPTSMLIIAG